MTTNVIDEHSTANDAVDEATSVFKQSLLSSLCRYSLPDAVVDFDWTECGNWHLICIHQSANHTTNTSPSSQPQQQHPSSSSSSTHAEASRGLKCWIDGEPRKIIPWSPNPIDVSTGSSHSIEVPVTMTKLVSNATTTTGTTAATATMTNTTHMNILDQLSAQTYPDNITSITPLTVGIGCMMMEQYYERDLIHQMRLLHHKESKQNNHTESSPSSSPPSSAAALASLDPEVHLLLQSHDTVIGSFVGDVGELCLYEDEIDAKALASIMLDGPMNGLKSLGTQRVIASLDLSLFLRPSTNALVTFNPSSSSTSGSTSVNDLTTAELTLTSNTVATPSKKDQRFHFFTSSSSSALQTSPEQHQHGSHGSIMKSSTTGNSNIGMSNMITNLRRNGSIDLHNTTVLSNALSKLGGLSLLYPLLLENIPRQMATLQVLSDLIVSSKSMFDEFLIAHTDKIILYVSHSTALSSSLESIQSLFEAVCPSNKISVVANTTNSSSFIVTHRIRILKLLIEMSLVNPHQPVLARGVIDWLRGICDDVVENASKVLECIGLHPILLLLSLWTVNDTKNTFKLSSSPDSSSTSTSPIESPEVGMAGLDHNQSKPSPSQTHQTKSRLTFDYNNTTDVNVERAKLQLTCGMFLRQLMTGTSGHEPLVSPSSTNTSASGSSQTPTGFNSTHFHSLVSFIQVCYTNLEIIEANLIASGVLVLNDGSGGGGDYMRSSTRRRGLTASIGNVLIKSAITGIATTSPSNAHSSLTTSNNSSSERLEAKWLLSAIVIALDSIISAAETNLAPVIRQFLRTGLPGIWDLCLHWLSSNHNSIRFRALMILSMTFTTSSVHSNISSQYNLEPDQKAISSFEKLNGFIIMCDQITKSPVPVDEAIVDLLLSLLFWRKKGVESIQIARCHTSISLTSNNSNEKDKLKDDTPNDGSKSTNTTSNDQKTTSAAASGSYFSMFWSSSSNSTNNNNSDMRSLSPQTVNLATVSALPSITAISAATTTMSTATTTTTITTPAATVLVSTTTTTTTATTTITQVKAPVLPSINTNTKTIPLQPPPSSSIPTTSTDITNEVEIIHIPQIFSVLISVLQCSRSLDVVQSAIKSVILAIDSSAKIHNKNGIIHPITKDRIYRNLESLALHCKDWIILLAQVIIYKRSKILGPLHNMTSSESVNESLENIVDKRNLSSNLSETESIQGDHYMSEIGSEDDRDSVGRSLYGGSAIDGGSESARSFTSRGMYNSLRKSHNNDQLEVLCAKFVEPFYILIEIFIISDLKAKSSTKRWLDIYRLSTPEFGDIQNDILTDLVQSLIAHPLAHQVRLHSLEIVIIYLKNFVSLLEQSLYKAENITLEFMVTVIKTLHILNYKCSPEIRAKLKDTGLPEIKNTFMVQCLMDCFDSHSRDLYSRATALTEINSSLQGYVTSLDTKVLQGSHVMLYILSIFIEAAEDLEAASNIDLKFAASGGDTMELMQRVQVLVDVMYVLIAITQSCVAFSQECKLAIRKLCKGIIGDPNDYILNILLKSEKLSSSSSPTSSTPSTDNNNMTMENRIMANRSNSDSTQAVFEILSNAASISATNNQDDQQDQQKTSNNNNNNNNNNNHPTGGTTSSSSSSSSWWSMWGSSSSSSSSTVVQQTTANDISETIVRERIPISMHLRRSNSPINGIIGSALSSSNTTDNNTTNNTTTDDIPAFIDWFCALEQKHTFEDFKTRINKEIKPILRKTERIHSYNTQRKSKHVQSQSDKIIKDKLASEKLIKDTKDKNKKMTLDKITLTFNNDAQTLTTIIKGNLDKGKTELESSLKVITIICFHN